MASNVTGSTGDPLFNPQVDDQFSRLLGIGADEREAFLIALREVDPDCAESVAMLLDESAEAHSFLVQAARPESVGPYLIRECIGYGGMGSVFRAEHRESDTVVAVKFVDTVSGLRNSYRFMRETRFLSQLDHDGIARHIDHGVTDLNVGYLVMEFVDGQDVLSYCRQHHLDLRDRLRLMVAVLDVVQYAHSQMVLHRDLKPSNIMVDRQGRVKLLDFGIAKLMEPHGPSSVTRTQHRFLTPRYASPEHQQGGALSAASDVYSLGVLLYRLVTARFPDGAVNEDESGNNADPHSMSRLLASGSLAAGRPSQVLLGEVKGDLDAIAMKAVAVDAADRYSSVVQFRADLDRYLAGRPVKARRLSRRYVFGKFIQRHRRLSFLLMLVIGLVTGWWAMFLHQARAVAEERDQARSVARFFSDMLGNVEPGRLGQNIEMVQVLDRVSNQLLEEPDRMIASVAAQLEVYPVLAQTYLELGKAGAAKELWELALAVSETKYGGQHALTRQMRVGLADTLVKLGEFDLAVSLLENTTALGDPVWQDKQQLVYARVAMERGDYELARECLDRVRSSDFETQLEAGLFRSKAACFAGDYELGLTTAREAYQRAVDGLGGNAPLSLKLLNQMGKCLRLLGQYDEAEQLIVPFIQQQCERLGQDHPDLADSMTNLAAVYVSTHRFAEAESILREVLTGIHNQPDLIGAAVFCRNSLAALLRKQGRLQEAADLYEELVPMAIFYYGQHSPQVLTIESNHAVCIAEMGDLPKAIPLLQQNMLDRQAFYSQEHPLFLVSQYLLGWYQLESRPAEAYGHLQAVWETRCRVLGETDLSSVQAAYAVALALRNLEQYDRSEELMRMAVAVREAQLGPSHRLTLFALDGLATVMRMAKDERSGREIARQLLQRVSRPDVPQRVKDRYRARWQPWLDTQFSN